MSTEEIRKFAQKIRLHTLKSLVHLGFGHFGGSLSIVDTLAVLYGKIMKVDPHYPHWDQRDYFVLSKGHAGPALYATLALKGYFPVQQLLTLNTNGTSLPSHPDRLKTPGVDATTGSLGQGVSLAAGIALSHQLRQKPNRTFCILGDGELNEGQCWEAFQFIAHRRLTNLCLIIDYNKLQLDGRVEDIINPFCLQDKFHSFGFAVETVEGNDIETLCRVFSTKPSQTLVVILNSKKGQGVPYIENLSNNHHLRLDDESRMQIQLVIDRLEAEYGE